MKLGVNIGHIFALPDIGAWLNLMQGFASIRWLNALRTNQKWWEAKKPGAYVPSRMDQLPKRGQFWRENVWWKGGGLHPADCVQYSADLHAHCWLTVPHRFDESQMRLYARAIKPVIPSWMTVRVEVGGEIFNTQFMHRHEYEAWGLAQGLSDNKYKAALLMHAQRTQMLARAFKMEGVSAEIVLSGHATNSWASQFMLENTAVGDAVDALAIAPYAGVRTKQRGDLYRELWEVGERCVIHQKLADEYNLSLQIYECDQHLIGANAPAWNRAEWMERWYLEYLKVLENSGVELAHIYSLAGIYHADTQKGTGQAWGLSEIVKGEFRPTPKLRAVQTFSGISQREFVQVPVDYAAFGIDPTTLAQGEAGRYPPAQESSED